MFLLALIAAQAADGVNNPGGERIPFIKLRSADWDIVIRRTADTRARVERAKARCGSVWINACAAGVDAPVRKHALQQAFRSGVKLSGDFSYCATAVLRDLPPNLARDLVNPDPQAFCQTFQDPESLRGRLDTDATQGENDLVNRLMGGRNTTSGQIQMKPVPIRPGAEPTEPGEEPPEGTVSPSTTERPDRPIEQPVPVEVPSSDHTPEATEPRPEPTPRPEPEEPSQASTVPRPDPRPPEPASAPPSEPAPGVEPAPKPDRPRPAPAPQPKASPAPARKPEAAPAPAPAPEPEAAPAPAPVPAPAPRPAPKPKPPPEPSEFELEQQDMENMERLSDVVAEEEEENKKKKKKKGKDDQEPEAPVIVGGDEDFDAYIIIDIEALPDE